MSKNIWALMCGALRMEFEFLTTLCCLCELREKGVITGISLSTWSGETDRIDGIREKLQKLDVSIIEHEPLEHESYADIGYLRQATQVKNGLRYLADDFIVLKCRTDYSNFDIHRMDVLFNGFKEMEPDKWGGFDAGFKNKIAVLRIGVSTPFAFHDTCFMGYAADIDRMTVLDNSELDCGEKIVPDINFFAGYFRHKYRIIRDFFRYVSIKDFRKYMREIRHTGDDFELPAALNKFYALYFVIAFSCFHICHEYAVSNEEITLSDIFYDSGTTGKAINDGPYTREIRSSRIIEMVVTGKLKATEGYIKLYNEIDRIKKNDYAESMQFTKEDYKELAEWGEKYLGIGQDKWLKPYPGLNIKQVKKFGFQKSAELLFSAYKVDEKTYKAIYDISFNKKSYYDTVIKYLDMIKEQDASLYKKALFCATRYLNDDVLLRVCSLLQEDSLSDDEQEEAEFVFKRYRNMDRIYAFPMSWKKLKAIYLYADYQNKHGIGDAGAELFKRMSGYFGEENDESYVNISQLKALMQAIAANRYTDERKEMQYAVSEVLQGV